MGNPGDIIWQSRMPGGLCILIKEFQRICDYDSHGKYGWGKNDFPIYRLIHPTEGLIDDPSYYYTEEISKDF